MFNIKQGLRNIKEDYLEGSHFLIKGLMYGLIFYLLVATGFGLYWNREPDLLPSPATQAVTGSATTQALLNVASALLDKPGGFWAMILACQVRLWMAL